jgi:hypothetical protein
MDTSIETLINKLESIEKRLDNIEKEVFLDYDKPKWVLNDNLPYPFYPQKVEKNTKIVRVKDNYFYTAYNLFDKVTINSMREDCDRQFNKTNQTPLRGKQNSGCIIDCHGHHLSNSPEYPYKENCWNTFCMAAKKHVVNYCIHAGIDPEKIIPHSCWSSRMVDYEDPNNYLTLEWNHSTDNVISKHLIGIIYYLSNPDPKYGTYVSIEKPKIKGLFNSKNTYYNEGIENSFFIFDAGKSYHSDMIPKLEDLRKKPKYVIRFDWYINFPYNKPSWELPKV